MSKAKLYHVWGKATDSNGDEHYVTIVGKFEQTRKRLSNSEEITIPTEYGKNVRGIIVYETPKILSRKLTLGVSICHPLDKFDENEGVKVAKRRIECGNEIGSIETHDVTMLTKDAILAELLVKLAHVTENIDEYLPLEE